MTDYNTFEIEDFTIDDYFVKWVLNPDKDSEKFWSQWLQKNPNKRMLVFEARELVSDLKRMQSSQIHSNYVNDIYEQISLNIKNKNLSSVRKIKYITFFRMAAAVFILGMLIFGAFYLTESRSKKKYVTNTHWINHQNNTSKAQTITLSDQSSITLEPFSSLKYPEKFKKDQRTVFLSGEAFFDVAKDTLRPFIVYANETITKVLGTSFFISAFEGQKTVEVNVISGKVAVYANVGTDKTKKSREILIEADQKIYVHQPNKKLDVTPNQRVIFDVGRQEMKKTIAEVPVIIRKPNEIFQFDFNDEQVSKVFEALEKAYGIEINYDSQVLNGCTISTKLDDEPLMQKIAIICSALNLNFKEENATVYVEGTGCKN